MKLKSIIFHSTIGRVTEINNCYKKSSAKVQIVLYNNPSSDLFIAIQAITPAVIITLVIDFIFRNIKPDMPKVEEIEVHSGMISLVFNQEIFKTIC